MRLYNHYFSALIVTGVMLGLLVPGTGSAQVRVGEVKTLTANEAMSLAPGSRQTVEEKGATFIKLHFSGAVLGTGGTIEVSDGAGNVVQTLTDADFNNGEGWAHGVDGDTVSVSANQASFTIDRYAYGTAPIESGMTAGESTIGSDDKRDRECFPGTNIYNRSRPVGRMLFVADTGGSFVCTGSVISHLDHFITNNHCVSSQSEVDSLDVRFNYERTTCGGASNKAFQTFGSAANNMLVTDAGRDFTLLTLAGNPSGNYHYLPLNGENLAVGDPLFIPQHPGGNPKMIHARHSGPTREQCRSERGDLTESGYTSGVSVRHTCDTLGGSSGSPVLNDAGQIVALHHTGTGTVWSDGGNGNGAIEMENIYPSIRGFLPQMQGGAGPGGNPRWVWYKVKEAWRYTNAAQQHRLWAYMLGTSNTLWIDYFGQPTLARMLIEAAASGHYFGVFWTGTTTWSNARLWWN